MLIAGELMVFGLVRCGMPGGLRLLVWAVRSGRLAATSVVATGITSHSRLMGYCPV